MLYERTIKISVVIPVYNVQEYVYKCIYSVQQQTMNNLEILCVDDGSTDNSLNIVKEFEKKDDRIRVFQKMNRGAGAARNFALSNAKGEFVCFLDADDYLLDKTSLEKLYHCAHVKQVHICGGQYYLEKDGSIENINIYGVLNDVIKRGMKVRYTDYQYDYNYTNYIYKRSLLLENQILFPEYRRFEDPPFFVKAMEASDTFCVLDIPFYCYRVGYKEIHYTEDMAADHMQGMMDNLLFSSQKSLRRLHRLTYYRILENCNRQFKHFIYERNEVLIRKLIEAGSMVQWEWLEETCKIRERTLIPSGNRENTMDMRISSEKWRLPAGYFEKGDRIALYGAGNVGRSYFRQLQKSETLSLHAWVDKNYENVTGVTYELMSPDQLVNVDFDYIVIGVAEIVMAMEIMDYLADLKIPADKIVWDIGR